MPSIPPYQDISHLTKNLCVSERTVDVWVKQGILPPPKNKGGKRLWKWSEVERYLDGDTGKDGEMEAIDEAFERATAR